MAKRQSSDKTSVDSTAIMVAVIAAIATVTAAYLQFVWRPSQQVGRSTPTVRPAEYVGRVLDSSTKAPIHGAKVALSFRGVPSIIYTDSEGIYRFTISFEGERLAGQVRVEAPGYDRYDRNVTLVMGNLDVEDIRLKAIRPKETATVVTSPPATDTATPVPTKTQTAEHTPTVEVTPTATASALRLHTVPLDKVANASTEEGYVSPPLGQLEIGGILFDLPPGRNSVTTQANSLPNFPTAIYLSLDIRGPERVYLLITGGNVFSKFLGKQIGMVNFYFAQGRPYSVPLVAGKNIREWKLLDNVTVSAISSSQVKEVWRTESRHKGIGIIDMLTIDLPDQYASDYLIAIEISDDSMGTVASMDPAVNLIGVTVLGH